MSPSKFFGIPESFSAHGPQVDHLIDVVHWFMIVLFIGWSLYMLVTLLRFRQAKQPKASYHGVTNHVSSHIEIAVIIVEAVLLLGFALPLWRERTDKYKVEWQCSGKLCVQRQCIYAVSGQLRQAGHLQRNNGRWPAELDACKRHGEPVHYIRWRLLPPE